jgi:hypothetical protein
MQKDRKTLQKIELVLENVDVITVLAEDIESVWLGDITESKYYSKEEQKFISFQIVNDFRLKLKENANRLHEEFQASDSLIPVFDRLMKCKDVCSVRIVKENGSFEDYHILWHEEDEYENRYESVEKHEDGLEIIVRKPKTVE